MLAHYQWVRDPRNPIFAPGPKPSFDCARCMTPFVVRHGDEYRLYYAGADENGHQSICLATASVRDLAFTRHGPIVRNGEPGRFDANWCVVPCLHRFGNTWHMYYSGNDGGPHGLQSFPGIGLATSDDGLTFTKYSPDPVITGDQTAEFPKNRGIAGGGTIVPFPQPGGATVYRMYYTLAVGRPSREHKVDQEKHCAVCHSTDGIRWTDHRLILSPRPEVPNEDVAVAAPFVWRDGPLFRMIYCGIGSRWNFYSMSEAVSTDGYNWDRGEGDRNLSLQPGAKGSWEEQMVEYPCVVPEGDGLRLFYCGNGYGATGIGTAFCRTAAPAQSRMN